MPIFYIWILMKSDQHKIESLIAPIVEAMGYEVWSVEAHRGGRKTLLRIYIDVPKGDDRKSINVEDCGQISKQLGALFDVENPVTGSYVLEVSSPGLNRSLTKLEHYQRYVGSIIHIVLKDPENDQYNFTGKLQEVFDNTLKLLLDNNEVIAFLLTNIRKANLVPSF